MKADKLQLGIAVADLDRTIERAEKIFASGALREQRDERERR